MPRLDRADRDRLRELATELLRFDTTDGNEGPAQRWLRDRLEDLGFRTYTWAPDPAILGDHPSFPPVETLDLADRPSVAGVIEFGDADAGHTLLLNGHMDVVPVERDQWTADPFQPTWDGDTLRARGAVDMKSQLASCVIAATTLAEEDTVDAGRIVVESVVGEERGGLGAATAAAANPYPFDRDAVIVAEPTAGRLVTATAGAAMVRLEIAGRSAHAARRWQGEDVLDRFEALRRATLQLEAERADAVTHPLFDRFDNPWPVVIGRVAAGNWASNVPANLTAEARLGVAPGETVAEVITDYATQLESVVATDDWLSQHPPTFRRYASQFEPAEIDVDEPIVESLQVTLAEADGSDPTPVGETYGADSRHFIEAGIPAAVFGPGQIDAAHFPDESIQWPAVERATTVYADTARRFLAR